jgi:hypothetical protein
MSYVSNIKSNLRGGIDVKLSPKTLILGANAAGKSMLMRSVELALRGKTSDLIWRSNVASTEALAALAPAGQGISATATFDDDSVATYSFTRKADNGGFGKPVHVLPPGFDPDVAFPLELFRAAALGSDAKLHAFLVRHATGEVLLKDVLARIPVPLHDRYNACAADLPGETDQVDVLLYVTATSRKRARDMKAQAEGADKTARASMSDVVPPDEEALARARGNVLAAQAQLDGAVARSSRAAAVARARAARAEIEKLEAVCVHLEEQLAELPQLHDDVRAALGTVIWHERIERAACLVCARPFDPAVRAERARLATEKLAGHERRPLVENALRANRARLEELTRIVDSAGPEELSDEPQISVADAQRLVTAAALDLRELEDSELRYRQASRARDAASRQASQAQELAQLCLACMDAVALFLVSGAKTFSKKVQAYLPAGDVFQLQVDPSDGACRYGLLRGGLLHSALSGAETIRVSAAVASAVASARPEHPTLILGEDRAWDSTTLAAALASLRESPAQILLPSTVEPDRLPPGWTVVRL